MKSRRTIWLVTQFFLTVAVRQRLAWAVILAGAILTLAGGVMREFNFGVAEVRFLTDYAVGVVAGLGALTVALLLPALLADSRRNGTAVVLQLHGARRWHLLAGASGAVIAMLGWLMVVIGGCFGVLLARLGYTDWVGNTGQAMARGALPLLTLVGAGALAAAVAREALLATMLTLGVALAGHLGGALEGAVERATGAARFGWGVFRALVPDFSLCDRLPYGLAVAYAGGFAAVYGLAALWLFSRRED